MRLKAFILSIGLISMMVGYGRTEEGPTMEDMYVTKPLLILKSTPDYADALAFAMHAAKTLGLKLDLRGLTPNAQTGLTFPANDCEENGGGFPCYVARGRYDDGSYVSIEHSTSYEGFKEGYYIVIGASGEDEVAQTTKVAKRSFPDVYAKSTKVYIGCMH